jgi:type IV pilus assembly protein PilW
MSAMHHPMPATPRGTRCHRGFTLIELMIAMVLGLIVIAGVTSVFLAGQQSYRTNGALADVGDSSRIAFELLARDIRQAGETGCDTASGRITNVLNNQGTAWFANFGNAVHGYGGVGLTGDPNDGDTDQGDPAVTTGTAVGDRVAGTDSLQIMGGGSAPVSIAVDNPGTNFFINEKTTDLATGDLIIVCSPDHAAILQVSNYNNNNVTVGYNKGSKNSPGNCSTNLGYPNPGGCTGNSPDYTFPQNSELSKLTASDWYIGLNPAGGHSLYHVALISQNGDAVTANDEVVRNVEDMQISYLQSPATDFVPAASVTDWSAVISVRITLKVQSTFQRASVNGDQPIVRSYSATTTIRNRVD